MPPGYEPLLAAVCAAPWDDLPRLVFADFLDDHGWRARAEFIRLQCEAAKGGPNAKVCQSRADRLMHRHKWCWREQSEVDGVWWSHHYRRGFPADAVLRGEPTAERMAAMVQAAPVERLSVAGLQADTFRHLAASPHLAAVVRLNAGYADDAGVRRLADNTAVARLDRLSLLGGITAARSALTDAAAVALARSPHLAQLRWLRLTNTAMSATGRGILTDRFGPNILVT